MATGVVDSLLFKKMFGTPAMRLVFSDEGLIERLLLVEAALARAQARLGLMPGAAAAEITDKARLERIDRERLAARTAVVGYPVVGLVEQLAEACDGDLGQKAHWGATTQDIMDTATVLRIRDGLALIEERLERASGLLARLVDAHRRTVMAGRTHLQQALPVTFGYKLAVILDALRRHHERLRELRERALVVQFGGAVGTLASLGEHGLEVRRELALELGLKEPLITWHGSRDRPVEVVLWLAMLMGTLGKFALDLVLLMQSEVGEAFEPFVAGRGSSSTMPQKRNPIAAEAMLASSKLVHGHAGTMLADHERATGRWHTEWQTLPESFVLTAGALAQAVSVLEGLEVDEARMARNLEATAGLIMAEKVVMELAPVLGRQKAHDLVQEACRAALESGMSFQEALLAAPDIAARTSDEELSALLDPKAYLGSADAQIEAVLKARIPSSQMSRCLTRPVHEGRFVGLADVA